MIEATDDAKTVWFLAEEGLVVKGLRFIVREGTTFAFFGDYIVFVRSMVRAAVYYIDAPRSMVGLHCAPFSSERVKNLELHGRWWLAGCVIKLVLEKST